MYDPGCERCLDMTDGDHDDDCAIAARDRILAAAEP